MERAFLIDKTARTSDRIVKTNTMREKTVYGVKTNKYITPQNISQSINQKSRAEKEEEVQLWDDLLNKARHEMPGATNSRINAIVYKQIQNIKHGKKEEADPELTLKPNVLKSQLSKGPAPYKPSRTRRVFRSQQQVQIHTADAAMSDSD